MNTWSVYIVKCNDGTFYTGSTNNLINRIQIHNSGKGAKYTRGRLPVILVCKKSDLSRSEALSLEAKVKKQSRDNKIKFLENFI